MQLIPKRKIIRINSDKAVRIKNATIQKIKQATTMSGLLWSQASTRLLSKPSLKQMKIREPTARMSTERTSMSSNKIEMIRQRSKLSPWQSKTSALKIRNSRRFRKKERGKESKSSDSNAIYRTRCNRTWTHPKMLSILSPSGRLSLACSSRTSESVIWRAGSTNRSRWESNGEKCSRKVMMFKSNKSRHRKDKTQDSWKLDLQV